MGIRDDLDRRLTDFISLRDLLNALSEHQSVTLEQAADWLTSQSDLPGLRERIDGLGVVLAEGKRLLEARTTVYFVVDSGAMGDEYAPGLPKPRDYDRFGFTRSAIQPFLQIHGIDLTFSDTGSATLSRSSSNSGEIGECDNLREQVSTLTARVAELAGSLDAANARIQELAGDLAQGKSRTAMLQVIGGVVMVNTNMDIHAARLDGLAKLRNDLQTVGVTIGEDALRTYLRGAADLIAKPASR